MVSKHDTSTNANDPNESELHNTLAHAIGRTDGNPLFVISQKSLTGHAKGGACIFQVNGLTQLFKSGVVPANAALDCVDPKLKRDDHMVWLREPLKVGSVKAGLATSLGFGHVSGFAAIVNPGAFEASVANTAGEDALNEWRDRANARLAAGQRRLEEGAASTRTAAATTRTRWRRPCCSIRTRASRPPAISKRETATSKSVLNMGK